MSKREDEKKQDTPADTEVPQGSPAEPGVTQGEPADTGAPQGTPGEPAATGADQGDDKVDKPVDDKVDEPVDDKVDEPVDELVDGKVEKAGSKRRRQYAFLTLSRCPRCKTTDTVATSTQGKVQYRRCLRAVCRWTYTVMGTKV